MNKNPIKNLDLKSKFLRFRKGEFYKSPVFLNKQRLETLTDGVYSIVMTLLVISLQVPSFNKAEDINEILLLEKLYDLLPQFYSYFLSFAILAMLWLAHHFVFHRHTKSIDRIVSHLNSLYLAFVALIPFSTAFLATYFYTTIGVFLYGLNILLVSSVNMIILLYIWKAKHIDNGIINSRLKTQARIRIGSIILTSALGMIFAFIYTPISIGLYLFAVLFNLIPGTLTFLEDLFGFRIK